MDGGEASGGGGAETGEEAMDVAVTAQQGNVIATPDGTNTQLAATDAQSQDAHTPAAAALAPAGMCTLQAVSAAADGRDSPTWGDMEVSTTTTAQLQNISVTPCDPVTSTEEETQPEGDHTASKAAELHQGAVCKAEDDSEDSDSDSSSSTSSTPPSVSGHLSGDDDEGFSQPAPIRCRDELLMEELPAVEDVNVMLPEEAELQPVGLPSGLLSVTDGYVTVFSGSTLLGKTAVRNNDRNPWWEEEFTWFLAEEGDTLKLEVHDNDILFDDLIGTCSRQMIFGTYNINCFLEKGGTLHYSYTLG